MGAMIGVLKNYAWNKATISSWSLKESCLMFGLPKHIDDDFN
jgi:hypothetical protein